MYLQNKQCLLLCKKDAFLIFLIKTIFVGTTLIAQRSMRALQGNTSPGSRKLIVISTYFPVTQLYAL